MNTLTITFNDIAHRIEAEVNAEFAQDDRHCALVNEILENVSHVTTREHYESDAIQFWLSNIEMKDVTELNVIVNYTMFRMNTDK